MDRSSHAGGLSLAPVVTDDPDHVDLSTSSPAIREALGLARSALLALVGTCRRALPPRDPEGQSALDRQLRDGLDAITTAATVAHPRAIARRTGRFESGR